MEIDSRKLAWLAGIVDGEGSIGFYVGKTGWKGNHNKKYTYHIAHQVCIANTNTLIIQEAHNIVSAILGEKTPVTDIQVVADRRPERTNSRIGYCVNVKNHNSVIKVLSALEPYLVGKKSQAQVMLNLLKNHRPYAKYTKVELQVIDLLKDMKKHNTTSQDDNAELSRESQDSQACVENKWATTQYSLGI